MRVKNDVRKLAIRYSEAFKMAVVRELETELQPYAKVQRKYGIKGAATVQNWARRYGSEKLGRIIRVEQPKEINEREVMKKRIKALEKALADAHLELAIERGCVRAACQRAGIEDVAEFKKKAGGK